MSKKSERSNARRAWLKEQLGGRCRVCGTVDDLQFDFIKSDGGAHHKLSAHDRVRAYMTEANRGNLQLLCGRHNREKSQREIGQRRNNLIWKKEKPQPVGAAAS